jgi:SAM-dependent methyltransferase
MSRTANRWEVSQRELEQIAEVRRRPLEPRAVLMLLLRRPELIPEVLRIIVSSGQAAVFANNSLISLLDAARAQTAVPDAAVGVGWYDEQPFLEALTPLVTTTSRVLELGCGGGRISRHVAPLASELVCTDQSRLMVFEARANLSVLSNVRVETTDGFALSEFADASFDIVFGQGVLGYLAPNHLLGLLDEVRRVLVAGGMCVFNYFTIDRPGDAQHHLSAVRGMARRRRLWGSVDVGYTRAQLDALYRVVGLEPLGTSTGSEGPGRGGRLVLVARAVEREEARELAPCPRDESLRLRRRSAARLAGDERLRLRRPRLARPTRAGPPHAAGPRRA